MSTSPGPWRWKPVDQLDRGGYPSEMPILLDCNGKEVCNFGDDTQYYPTEGTPPGAEDAALIVSAPDMLALIRKLSTWRPCGLEGQIEDDVAGIRQEACALLARVSP